MRGRERYGRLADWLFERYPGAGLRLAERRAAALLRERKKKRKPRPIPSEAEFTELLGAMPEGRLAELRRRCAVLHARTTLVKQCAEDRGLWLLSPLIEVEGGERVEALARAGGGALVTSWHSGPEIAVWSMLADRGIRLLRVQNTLWKHPPGGWEILRREYAPGEGFMVLKVCQKRLREGGWVGFSFDNHAGGEKMETVEFLGRAVPYPVGTGVLSVRTGAPILPVFARWSERGRRIVLEVHPPLKPEDYRERFDEGAAGAMVADLVKLAEHHARKYPWELNGRRVRQLLEFPRMGETGTGQVKA